jgi:hypothetical protein
MASDRLVPQPDAPSLTSYFFLDHLAALYEPNKEGHNGNDKKNVNEAAHGV